MAAREKVGVLILLNAVSVVGYLSWLGWSWVKAMGSAFSTGAHSSSEGELANVLLAGVAVAVVACGVGSFYARAGVGRWIALAPIALLLLSQGIIDHQRSADRRQWAREHSAARPPRKRNLQGISKDYIIRGRAQADDDYADESFLTHDQELNTIVCIEEGENIRATPIGKVDGNHLDTLLSREELVRACKWYVDREGKHVFDRYVLRHRPDLDRKEFHLEKYER